MKARSHRRVITSLTGMSCQMLGGCLLPLMFCLIALALPTLFAAMNLTIAIGQFIALLLVILAIYLALRVPRVVANRFRQVICSHCNHPLPQSTAIHCPTCGAELEQNPPS